MASADVSRQILKKPRLNYNNTAMAPTVRMSQNPSGMSNIPYDGSRTIKFQVHNTNPNVTGPLIGQFVMAMGSAQEIYVSEVIPKLHLMTLPEVNYFLQQKEPATSTAIDPIEVLDMYFLRPCGFINAFSENLVTIGAGGRNEVRLPLSPENPLETYLLVARRVPRTELQHEYKYSLPGSSSSPITDSLTLHKWPVQLSIEKKSTFMKIDSMYPSRMMATINYDLDTPPLYKRQDEREPVKKSDAIGGTLLSATTIWTLGRRTERLKTNYDEPLDRSTQQDVKKTLYGSDLVMIEVRIHNITDC